MARYPGGTEVPGGYYWNPRKWTLTSVLNEGGVLPGDASQSYLKIHWVAALLLAPVLGGLFVLALPFVGLAMLARWLFLEVAGGARRGAKDLAATVSPGWRPGEAHLTGRAAEPPADVSAGGAGEKALEDVAHEIAKKRKEERGNGD
jgi:hypothetical protein